MLLRGGGKNEVIQLFREAIYQFHMPLMFFISGMLSGKTLRLQEVSDRKAYVRDRFQRLMVPYFTIAVIYLPFKIVLSRFANQPYDVVGIWKIFLGENPDGGLWFLYVLFLIQMVMALLLRRNNVKLVLILGLLCSLLVVAWNTHWFRVDDAIFYFCFVMMGLCFSISESFNSHFNRLQILAFLLLLVCSLTAYFLTYSPLCKFFSGMFASFFIVGFSKFLDVVLSDGCRTGATLKSLGNYTMDIYIFHGILMVVVRIVFWSVLHWNYYLCCLLMFIVGILVPLYISKKVVRPIPLFRKIFLGDFK